MKKFLFSFSVMVLLLFSLQAHALYVAGNPKGDVTLVEFMDFACPHCRREAPVVDRLIQANPDFRVVYRVIPAFGRGSRLLDSLMLAARYQSQGYPRFRALVLAQPQVSSPGQVLRLAKRAGLNEKRLMRDLFRPQIQNTLNHNLQVFYATKQLGIPVLMLGSLKVKRPLLVTVGEQPYAKLQAAVDAVKEQDHAE